MWCIVTAAHFMCNSEVLPPNFKIIYLYILWIYKFNLQPTENLLFSHFRWRISGASGQRRPRVLLPGQATPLRGLSGSYGSCGSLIRVPQKSACYFWTAWAFWQLDLPGGVGDPDLSIFGEAHEVLYGPLAHQGEWTCCCFGMGASNLERFGDHCSIQHGC